MQRLNLLLLLLFSLTLSCEEELLYDLETQLAIDIALIDEYLNANNIDHIKDDSGIRYEILHLAQGDEVQEGEWGRLEISIWKLDGTFFGSTNPSIDALNGGDPPFLINSGFSYQAPGTINNYSFQQYLSFVVPKMTEGDKFRVYVPSPFAFGYNIQPPWHGRPIAPNTNLIIELEITEIGRVFGN